MRDFLTDLFSFSHADMFCIFLSKKPQRPSTKFACRGHSSQKKTMPNSRDNSIQFKRPVFEVQSAHWYISLIWLTLFIRPDFIVVLMGNPGRPQQPRRWESDWQMSFHLEKCEVIHITTKKKPIIHKYTLHGHTLSSKPSTPWPFRYPQPVKMFICIASSPRLSGTGMTFLNP